MESTSFLEELSRTDEVASVPSRGGGGGALANGTMMPQDVVSGPVEMQQRMPQQASWGMNQLPHGAAVHYQNAEYGQYNAAAKQQQQQQRMVHMSGYGSGMMPTGNSGPLQNHPNAAQYGYSGMHSVAMTPPRGQAMSGSATAWNQSPRSSGMASDQLASPSYPVMTGQHGGMVQQHRSSVPQQMQMSAVNRSNGMQAQMYSSQYHDFAAAGTMQQTRMMGYSDSQHQMQEMGMSGGYSQPMGSPPAASTRLMQMSGQAGQMPSQLHYQQQQHYPSLSASMDSAHYIADSQSHGHTASGHVMNQYQYNSAMMQGQPRMPGDGYGQFYAQPLYRMPAGYGATTQAQGQMMSPNAMAQMSPQARSAARPPDIRSPQPTQVPVCSVPRLGAVGSSVPSSSFRPSIPSHTVTYTVAANSTSHVSPQRMSSGDAIKAAYPAAMPTPGSVSAGQQASLMIGSAARYAVPAGYQMNAMNSMSGAAEMRQQQMYSGQQQQVVDTVDRSHCYPPSHPQGYYQPQQQQQQQSQYPAASVMMGGLSPGQMVVHKQSQMVQQPQQQLQLMPSGQATASSVSPVRC